MKYRARTFLVYAQHFVTMISWYMICSTYTKTSPLAVVYTILTLYYCAYQDHVHLPILQMSPMQLPLHLEGISYISYFGRIFSQKNVFANGRDSMFLLTFIETVCSTDARMPLFSTKAVCKILLAKSGTNCTDFELTSSIVYSDIYWICCHFVDW